MSEWRDLISDPPSPKDMIDVRSDVIDKMPDDLAHGWFRVKLCGITATFSWAVPDDTWEEDGRGLKWRPHEPCAWEDSVCYCCAQHPNGLCDMHHRR